MKLIIPVFYRATYYRNKTLIEELNKYHDLHLLLSGSLLKEQYGNLSKKIINNHPGVNFHFSHSIDSEDSLYKMSFCTSDISGFLSSFYNKINPDGVIVIADRFETLAAAFPATFQNIPVIHIQGGEITGNIDQRVRFSVSQLSDYHFTCTKKAKEKILSLGFPEKRVFNFGCPSIDQLVNISSKEIKDFIILIYHPETDFIENVSKNSKIVFDSVIEFVNELRRKKQNIKLYIFVPNQDPGRHDIMTFFNETSCDYIEKIINMESEKFLKLLSQSKMIVGNSSCGIREASFLGIPSVDIGQRQAGRERSENCIHANYNKHEIIRAMRYQDVVKRYKRSYLYGNGKAGRKIAKKITKINRLINYQPRLKNEHWKRTKTT